MYKRVTCNLPVIVVTTGGSHNKQKYSQDENLQSFPQIYILK